ncbi:MAG: SCO family protein [Ramlibacter sp.]|nr:SCO family protein [Ramlibacter sp.]
MKSFHFSIRRRHLAVPALAMASGLLASCAPEKPKCSSIDITGAEYARDFSLKDHNGRLRSLKDFRGQIVAVFFGFTHCPEVCPTTMAEMAEIKKLLGPDGNKLQVILVTVDPQRDTPEILKAYMGNFDPAFLAMSPSPQELAAVAKEFKIYYKKVEGRTPTSYSMDHTAGTYIFDAQGRIRIYGRYGSGAPALAADIRLLLKEA